MPIVFPPLLPTLSVVAPFSAVEPDCVIRTRMDAGPAKVRRRTTAAPAPRQMGHPAYSLSQLAAFLEFFTDTTAGGSLSFEMPDPVFGDLRMWRFAAPPTWSGIGADLYSISVQLEQMP